MTQPNSTNPYSFDCAGAPLASRIVLLTGVNRSGTTLLGNLVGSFKNVEYDFEPWIFHCVPMMVASGQIQPDAATEIFRAYFNETLTANILGRNVNFRPTDDTRIWQRLSMDEIFERWREVKDRWDVQRFVQKRQSILSVKVTNFAPFLGLLWGPFPQSKIIHIVRNPIHLALSIQKRGWVNLSQLQELEGLPIKKKAKTSEGKTIFIPWWVVDSEVDYFLQLSELGRAVYAWRVLTEMSEAEINRLELRQSDGGRFLEIHYEDLLANPHEMMEKLSHFIQTNLTEETGRLIQTIRTDRIHEKVNFPFGELPERERKKLGEWLERSRYRDETLQLT